MKNKDLAIKAIKFMLFWSEYQVWLSPTFLHADMLHAL